MLTAVEVEERRNWVGASDCSTLLGLNHHKSAYDLFLEKTGQVDIQFSGSQAADVGLLLEDAVLQIAEEQLGPIVRPTDQDRLQFRCGETRLRASLDGLHKSTSSPVEAKTSGLFGPLSDEWGPDDTDEAPPAYIVQVHAQMMCVGDAASRAYIVAFLGGRGPRIYTIDRDDRICKAISQKVDWFWSECVEKRIPPPDSAPSMDVLKCVRRTPNKIVELDHGLVGAWLAANEQAKAAQKTADEAKAKVIAALGDAEAGTCGALGAITYFSQHRDGYTVKPCDYRVLYHKKKGL